MESITAVVAPANASPMPPFGVSFIYPLVILLASSILIHLIYATILYPSILTPLKNIPTPPGRSLLKGTKGQPSGVTQVEKFRYWTSKTPNDGLIRFYQTGSQERLLVTNAKALSEILVSNATNFVKPKSVQHRLSHITGNGLLLAEGEEHKMQRRSLMPAFSYRHIKNLYPVFWSKAKEMARGLEDEVKGNQNSDSKVIEVRKWATRTTLDIIGLAGMDHDFDSLRNPKNSLSQQYQQMRPNPSRFEILIGMVLSVFSKNAAVFVASIPSKRRSQASAASGYIRTVCHNIIQEKQAKIKSDAAKSEVDIITVALKSSTFSSGNLVDQMMTFLAAGHGTTSHALQWAVYALCKDEQIQKRLRQEVCNGLPSVADPEYTVSAAQIDGIAYLHAFCNEVLRFYPPVPTTIRENVHETTVAGHRIPPGTNFAISPGVINLDKELWGPDAETFNPDRWMQEGCANTGGVRNNYGFLTFLHGPRSCIGATFARAELACLVAALVSKFHMELENPDKTLEVTKRGIGSAPVDGVRAKFRIVEE